MTLTRVFLNGQDSDIHETALMLTDEVLVEDTGKEWTWRYMEATSVEELENSTDGDLTLRGDAHKGQAGGMSLTIRLGEPF